MQGKEQQLHSSQREEMAMTAPHPRFWPTREARRACALSRLYLTEAILLHFGATDEERKDALKRMQVEQIEGGPNHGMFVAKDALAQLKGILPGNAEKKIKTVQRP